MKKVLLLILGLFIFIGCQLPEENTTKKKNTYYVPEIPPVPSVGNLQNNYYYKFAEIELSDAQVLINQEKFYNKSEIKSLFNTLANNGRILDSDTVTRTPLFDFLRDMGLTAELEDEIKYQLDIYPGNTILTFSHKDPTKAIIMYIEKK